MNVNRWKILGGVMIILALSLTSAVLAADDRGGEVGVLFGFTFPDEHATGKVNESEDTEFSLGFRGGAVFSKHWGWYADGLFTGIDTAPTLDADLDELTLRTGLDVMFQPEKNARWFITLGAGWNNLDYKNIADSDYIFGSLGFGQRIWLGGKRHFRWEIRGDQSLDDEGPLNDSITQLRGVLGVSWGPGGKATDSDGDGVVDRRDKCPDTPSGARVDERGCPKDTDGDGVFDGIDKCPDTPKGWAVNADGCPKDTDGDGVVDGRDKCPDTPRGAGVDADGCPKDTDGDGVFDGIDKCAGTPKGAKVDRSGCPVDSDGDGVADGIDACPDTPRGAKVDAKGCPMDTDGDGVFDGIDKCPGTPRGTKVNSTGCPAESKKLFEEGKKTLILEGVNFETNKATLRPDSRATLDRVARSLREWPAVRIEIGGHTDSSGADGYNQKLSERRAQTVLDYLVGKGVSAANLSAKGYGESRPIADNTSAAGKAKNRRVELKKN